MSRPGEGAPILAQIEGQYEKFLLMILRKYVPKGAVLTKSDIERFVEETEQGDPLVLFSYGHRDSIEFKAIRHSDADRIVEHHNKTHKGRA